MFCNIQPNNKFNSKPNYRFRPYNVLMKEPNYQHNEIDFELSINHYSQDYSVIYSEFSCDEDYRALLYDIGFVGNVRASGKASRVRVRATGSGISIRNSCVTGIERSSLPDAEALSGGSYCSAKPEGYDPRGASSTNCTVMLGHFPKSSLLLENDPSSEPDELGNSIGSWRTPNILLLDDDDWDNDG